jgi:phage major head subunit gpT-like protein
MPALTPTFLFDFESEMQRITENEFVRLQASENLWWREVTKVRTTGKKREIIAWLLSTAQIRDQGLGGNINFDDMAATFQEYDIRNSGEGLVLKRDQVEDNDGNGFDFAAEWSQQMGAQMAYWPQKKMTSLLLNGTAATSLAYDNVSYFTGNATKHPFNQFRPSSGGFANLLTGAASSPYPGALPIDESVSVDVALLNLQKAIAYIASIKMPNGVDPRFLRARRLMVPPRLVARAQQLTNARYIAQPTNGNNGGGSGDIEAVISNWGFLQPLEVQELAGATYANGADPDKTWFLATESVSTTQLGALVYVDREPFRITYYTGQGGGTGVDAVLDRARELEWHVQGRNVGGYGHPYGLFMVMAV